MEFLKGKSACYERTNHQIPRKYKFIFVLYISNPLKLVSYILSKSVNSFPIYLRHILTSNYEHLRINLNWKLMIVCFKLDNYASRKVCTFLFSFNEYK